MLRIAMAVAITLAAAAADAQDAPAAGPCRSNLCVIAFDWGSQSAASHGSDRRYGPAADLESHLPRLLEERGLRVATAGSAVLTMTVRPKVRFAMCDQMAGTDTNYTCKTISEVQIQFMSSDTTRTPNAVRVTNRCGAGDTFMTVMDFARYTADMVAYQLAEDKSRGRRPTSKC